jgi:predicted RNA binding protein YcfA (HicA-like mRNA interferase family)
LTRIAIRIIIELRKEVNRAMGKGSSKYTTGELIRLVLKSGAVHTKTVGSHWMFEHENLPGEKLPVPHAGKASQKGKQASIKVEKSVLDFIARAKKK